MTTETFLETLESIYVKIDLEAVSDLMDPARVPYEALPYLAEMAGAKLYTEILGEEYARETVANAWLFNLRTGTKSALDEFAEDLGIVYTLRETTTGSPARVTSFTVTVSNVNLSGVNITEYLVRSIKALLPVTVARVDGNTVQIAVSLSGRIRHEGAMIPVQYVNMRTA